MARPQKYDWAKIEIDYKAGMSQEEFTDLIINIMDEVAEKYEKLKNEDPILAQRVMEIISNEKPKENRVQKSDKWQYVYIVEMETTEYIKIGVASNIQKRLSSMQSSSPFKMLLLGCIKKEDAYKYEAKVHEKYKQFRVREEWFMKEHINIDKVLGGSI
jgi:hypothetical protein